MDIVGFQFECPGLGVLDALLDRSGAAENVGCAGLGGGPCDNELCKRAAVLLSQVGPAGEHVEQALPVLEFEPWEPVPGVLAEIAASIGDSESNIDQVSVDERHEDYADLSFMILVRDRTHLAQVIRAIRRIPMVEKISRTCA